MLQIFQKNKVITGIDRFNTLYFFSFFLFFLFFFLGQTHSAGPHIVSPQYILDKRITFTSSILLAFCGLLCLSAFPVDPLKQQYARIPAAKLPSIISRTLRVFALTLPFLALIQCLFLLAGKSVLAETHPLKNSPQNVWCSSCRQGINPFFDDITKKLIEPLSYLRAYRLFFGTRSALELLTQTASNARLHGDYKLEGDVCRERLSLIEEIKSDLEKRNAFAELAYNLQRQGKDGESLPFFQAALTADSKLKPSRKLNFLLPHCELLANAACAREKTGNEIESERLWKQIIDSPISDGPEGMQYKLLPDRTVVSNLRMLEKAEYEKLLLLMDKTPDCATIN